MKKCDILLIPTTGTDDLVLTVSVGQCYKCKHCHKIIHKLLKYRRYDNRSDYKDCENYYSFTSTNPFHTTRLVGCSNGGFIRISIHSWDCKNYDAEE
jgi:hypothetical protein